jgi:hypothetical protein
MIRKTAIYEETNDHNIDFKEKRQFSFGKNRKNSDHNIVMLVMYVPLYLPILKNCLGIFIPVII